MLVAAERQRAQEGGAEYRQARILWDGAVRCTKGTGAARLDSIQKNGLRRGQLLEICMAEAREVLRTNDFASVHAEGRLAQRESLCKLACKERGTEGCGRGSRRLFWHRHALQHPSNCLKLLGHQKSVSWGKGCIHGGRPSETYGTTKQCKHRSS